MSSNQMDSEALVKETTKLEKYLVRTGHADLARELRALGNTERLARLQKQAIHRQEIQDARLADEDLTQAKRAVAGLAQTYNEQTRFCDRISRFIHLLNQE